MNYKIYSGTIQDEEKMTSVQSNSFDNNIQTVLLPAGYELWRFISEKTDNPFGAFWIDSESMRIVMNIFHFNSNFSQEYKNGQN